MKTKELYYGTVLITKGKYKGKIGYYDDDGERNLCIVYLGSPLMSKYISVRASSIENTEIPNLSLNKLKKDNPALCLVMGVD